MSETSTNLCGSDCPEILSLDLAGSDATSRFAVALSALVGAGDFLCLEGDLGAGKTHFARALIQARLAAVGAFEDVPSPSFTLVQTYVAGPLEIWHCDLYRVQSASELWELGLEEAIEDALCLVEWPDRMATDIPANALWLVLRADPVDPDMRHLTIRARPESGWGARLVALAGLQ